MPVFQFEEYINVNTNVFDPDSVGFESEYIWTFYEPNWVISNELLKKLEFRYPNLDVETLFLNVPFKDKISGNVKDLNYWVEKDFIRYEPNNQTGFMPTVLDESSLRLSDLKIDDGTLVVPKYLTTFTMINNVKGKTGCIWTLYNSLNEEQITVKAPPYFIWRFFETGDYYLKAEVIDQFGNSHISQTKHAFKVLDIDDYVNYIETKLDARIKTIGQ